MVRRPARLLLCAFLAILAVRWAVPEHAGDTTTIHPARELRGSSTTPLLRADAAFILPRVGSKFFWGCVVGLLGIVFVLCEGVLMWSKRAYAQVKIGNRMDLDEYVADVDPAGSQCLKIMLYHKMNVGNRVASHEAVKLAETPSTAVKGLRITSKFVKEGDHPFNPASDHNGLFAGLTHTTSPIIVGTIRMGFGHHRIAYAASSWGIASGHPTYFHDLLNIESAEANLIKDTDKIYSKGSRMATELGGTAERIWGAMTKSGNENMFRAAYQMGEHLEPLFLGLPKDAPIIATHSLVGLAAVACGFTRVINLVIDNHAQWFCIVPGALNLVQGPSNYHSYLKMGVPASDLQLVGHWIPKDLVDNIVHDCTERKQRAQKKAPGSSQRKSPCRLLIPVGGAGAQRTFVSKFIVALAPDLKAGKIQLFLNAGDHKNMIEAFTEALQSIKVVFDTVDTIEGVHDFCNGLHKGGDPKHSVTLFAFPDYFPAVATTDLVSRVSDVLCCKPSELAFYPLPKLMIRRVGDHELYSALRASELGDGTLEVREVEDALKYVQLFQTPDLLVQMNDCIMKNASIGLYDGCKNAIKLATRVETK